MANISAECGVSMNRYDYAAVLSEEIDLFRASLKKIEIHTLAFHKASLRILRGELENQR